MCAPVCNRKSLLSSSSPATVLPLSSSTSYLLLGETEQMVRLELRFLSESSNLFCAQFTRFAFFANSVLSRSSPPAMSHKSLVFVGHRLLAAARPSHLISFCKGRRRVQRRSLYEGGEISGSLTTRVESATWVSRPVSFVFLCVLITRFRRLGQPLRAWRILGRVKCLWLRFRDCCGAGERLPLPGREAGS